MKNNRSVNLAKLKSFWKNGNCVINKEELWQLQILDPTCILIMENIPHYYKMALARIRNQ
jgi:hypothetical protein